MFYAPNIRKLEVETTPQDDRVGWLQMLTDAETGQAPPHINKFSHLKYLHVSMADGNFRLGPMFGVLCLPSLTDLVLKDCCEQTESAESTCPVRESNIT